MGWTLPARLPRAATMTEARLDDAGVRWMLAWQAGDEAAFDELVEAYSRPLYALFTRFLGPRGDREDLVQETFLRVIRARGRYEATARFSTWLYRIAYNLAVNKTERRRQEWSLDAPAGTGADAGPAPVEDLSDPRAEDPSAPMERGDVVAAVRSAIADLPETQRMALILAKYEEMPYVEIAGVLGSSEKAIKSLIHRARERLRERLAPWMEEEPA